MTQLTLPSGCVCTLGRPTPTPAGVVTVTKFEEGRVEALLVSPVRPDPTNLARFFEVPVEDVSIVDLVEEGDIYLAEVVVRMDVPRHEAAVGRYRAVEGPGGARFHVAPRTTPLDSLPPGAPAMATRFALITPSNAVLPLGEPLTTPLGTFLFQEITPSEIVVVSIRCRCLPNAIQVATLLGLPETAMELRTVEDRRGFGLMVRVDATLCAVTVDRLAMSAISRVGAFLRHLPPGSATFVRIAEAVAAGARTQRRGNRARAAVRRRWNELGRPGRTAGLKIAQRVADELIVAILMEQAGRRSGREVGDA